MGRSAEEKGTKIAKDDPAKAAKKKKRKAEEAVAEVEAEVEAEAAVEEEGHDEGEGREGEGKKAEGPSATSVVKKTTEGDEYIDLSSKRRVTVRMWHGGLMVDVREMYDKFGELHPGKKGIALNLPQWRALMDRAGDIEGMIQRAQR